MQLSYLQLILGQLIRHVDTSVKQVRFMEEIDELKVTISVDF